MTTFPSGPSDWSIAFAPILLDMALKGLLLLALAALAAVLVRRGSAAARHLVWFLAILGVLMLPALSALLPAWHVLPGFNRAPAVEPMAPAAPLSAELPALAAGETAKAQVEPALPPATETRAAPRHAPVPLAMEDIQAASAPPSRTEQPTEPEAARQAPPPLPDAEPTPSPETPAQPAPPALISRLLSWLGPLWLSGVLLALLPLILAQLSLWRLRRTAHPVRDPLWQALLEDLTAKLQVRRRVLLLESPCRTMPMTWGALPGTAAKLLLPEDARDWSADRRRAVLLHELAHIKRRDCLTQWITQAACVLHWFNPLAWYAAHRMLVEREQACDDLVLVSDTKASSYAQHLLAIAAGPQAGPLTRLAGIPMARRSKLEGRLLAVLDTTRNRQALSRWSILTAAALLMAAVVPVAMLQAEDEPEDAADISAPAETADPQPATTVESNSQVKTAAFEPVIERELQWGQGYFDLDTGKAIRLAPLLERPGPWLHPWQGEDLGLGITNIRSPEGEDVPTPVLTGEYLDVLAVGEDQWEKARAADILAAFRGREHPDREALTLVKGGQALPATFLFRTRPHESQPSRIGILQVLDFDAENPKKQITAQIRYKLVEHEFGRDQEAAQGDPQQRIRELIYVLRHATAASRVNQWAGAIKELVEIGEPAVPELVAELKRTGRDATQRMIAFTLRAIGDSRAVPALIRALPETRVQSSDLGLYATDPELMAFMQAHDLQEDRPGPDQRFGLGRAVREITMAIEALTGDSMGHHHLALTGPGPREEIARHWQRWWKNHRDQFVTDEGMAALALPEGEADAIEAAGVARFGPIFPTGPEQRLGPVREVVLPSARRIDIQGYIDLDTGQTYALYEGMKRAERASGDHFRWIEETGIDASGSVVWFGRPGEARQLYSLRGYDMHVWPVENQRWETFEEEIGREEPLTLPDRSPVDDFIPRDPRTDQPARDRLPATFVFTTASGARGILQALEQGRDAQGMPFRYRLIEGTGQPAPPKQEPEPDAPEAGAWGPVAEVTMHTPHAEEASVLDLDTGRLSAAPAAIPYPPVTPELQAWLRDRGADAIGVMWEDKSMSLVGSDMVALRVSERQWEALTVAKLKEILGRGWSRKARASIVGPEGPAWSETVIFQTREGGMGILQIVRFTNDPRGIRIRYKLAQVENDAAGAADDEPQPDPNAQARKRFKQPVPVDFHETPFTDVVAQLQEATGVPIIVHWPHLKQTAIGPDFPVTVRFIEAIPASDVLAVVLHGLGEGVGRAALDFRYEQGLVVLSLKEAPYRVPEVARPEVGQAQQVWEKLRKPTAAEFDGRLSKVIDFIRDTYDVEVAVRWRELGVEGITPDTPVRMTLPKISGETMLRLVLEHVSTGLTQLRYEYDKGVVVVTVEKRGSEPDEPAENRSAGDEEASAAPPARGPH